MGKLLGATHQPSGQVLSRWLPTLIILHTASPNESCIGCQADALEYTVHSNLLSRALAAGQYQHPINGLHATYGSIVKVCPGCITPLALLCA